ncbi:MAG: hypothetical protein QXT25_00575 [Candidatus Anstonellaceae archaeon]
MSLLQDFQAQSGIFDIAIIAATISILIGGIVFGLGIGFGIKRLRLMGAEEIAQGIISAAMLGGIISFAAIADASVSSLVPTEGLPSCPPIQAPTSSPFAFYSCFLYAQSSSFSLLASYLYRCADISGIAGSIQVKTSEILLEPFFALKSYSQQLAGLAAETSALAALSAFELEIALTVRNFALALFLPAGLLLRTFFATRRLGAAIMAISVAAYLIYPIIFLHSFQVSKTLEATQQAINEAESFSKSFASLPLLELDQPAAVKSKISQMAQGDFPGKVQALFPTSAYAIWMAKIDLIFYPLLSLVVCAVASLELYRLFSAQVFFSFIDSI